MEVAWLNLNNKKLPSILIDPVYYIQREICVEGYLHTKRPQLAN